MTNRAKPSTGTTLPTLSELDHVIMKQWLLGNWTEDRKGDAIIVNKNQLQSGSPAHLLATVANFLKDELWIWAASEQERTVALWMCYYLGLDPNDAINVKGPSHPSMGMLSLLAWRMENKTEDNARYLARAMRGWE